MLRTRSYGSVEITSVDLPALRSALRERAARLAGEHPEIVEVLLYGSVARGDATPDSDVDLLVVVAACEAPFLERADPYREAFSDFPLDVWPVVYTREEMRQGMEAGNAFLASALADARRLHPLPGPDEDRPLRP